MKLKDYIKKISGFNLITEKRRGISIYLISPFVLSAADFIIDILNWIYKNLEICSRNPLKSRRQIVAYNALYTVLACELQKIIINEFDHVKYRLNKIRVKQKSFTHCIKMLDRAKKIFQERRLFSRYEFFRNKFFAHSSWVAPTYHNRRDNPSLLISSLLMWSGANIDWGKTEEKISVIVGRTVYAGNLFEIFYNKKGRIFRRIYFHLKGNKKLIKLGGLEILREHKLIEKHLRQEVFRKFYKLLADVKRVNIIR